MLGAPALWQSSARRLAEISATFLEVQVRAGAAAVQLFDSWAGSLPAADYRDHVQPLFGGACWTGSVGWGCRGSTSASAPRSCSA